MAIGRYCCDLDVRGTDSFGVMKQFNQTARLEENGNE
jgi:hypothetical protein